MVLAARIVILGVPAAIIGGYLLWDYYRHHPLPVPHWDWPTRAPTPVSCPIRTNAEPPALPDDPTQPPGEGWEWRGKGPPGSSEGSWYHPGSGQSCIPT